MADELIRLDTTIIGIDSLINKASTAEEAKVLFTVKDVIYSQQRYVTDVQPVKHGRWIDIYEWAKMHDSIPSGMCLYYWCSECQEEQEKKSNFCPHCGARMLED